MRKRQIARRAVKFAIIAQTGRRLAGRRRRAHPGASR